jgi:hypothetical protein
MTDEQLNEEGSEEAIEDLEAPAATQDDVAGGVGCGNPSLICTDPTCDATVAKCTGMSHKIVVHEQFDQ